MASMSDKVFRQQPRPAEQSKPAEQPKAPPVAPADPLSAVAMSKAEVEAPAQPKIEPKPEEKKPWMQRLKDSGNIENDADNVVFIYSADRWREAA